jgi:hypothetical protein
MRGCEFLLPERRGGRDPAAGWRGNTHPITCAPRQIQGPFLLTLPTDWSLVREAVLWAWQLPRVARCRLSSR